MWNFIGQFFHDMFFYIFIVASLTEFIWRFQNVLSRFSNSSRTWPSFALSVRSEIASLTMETLHFGSEWNLFYTLAFGTLFQIILQTAAVSYPSVPSLAVMVLLFCCTWFYRSPRQGMGYALAWSYYFGYLKIMLPELMRNQRRYKGEEVVGFFILLPEDCNVYDQIEECDDRMKHIGSSEPLRLNVGGQIGRQYAHSVYKVRGSKADRFFLAYVEYPTPIKHFATLSGEPYKNDMHFTEDERRYQLRAFGWTLETILRDWAPKDIPEAFDKKIEDFFQIIYFDGARNTIAARIGEREWNMAGHPTRNQWEGRSPFMAQESVDETYGRRSLRD